MLAISVIYLYNPVSDFRLSCCLWSIQIHSFQPRTMKLGMEVTFDRAVVMGYMKSASAASEVIRGHTYFWHAKSHGSSHFSALYHNIRVAQRPQFRGTGWPQNQFLRSTEVAETKNQIFLNFSNLIILNNFYNNPWPFQIEWPQIRPPRSIEVAEAKKSIFPNFSE